jgi:hypothetical protein
MHSLLAAIRWRHTVSSGPRRTLTFLWPHHYPPPFAVNPDKQPDLNLELPAGEMLSFPDEPLSPEALYA